MHFTDSCRFLISSAFKFTALCTILPHFQQSLGALWVPGLIPGADLSETWTTPLKAVYGQKANPDSNSGPTDLQATTEPLCHGGLLIWAHVHKITNEHVIYTALYIMILMWANPLRGPLEGP